MPSPETIIMKLFQKHRVVYKTGIKITETYPTNVA